MHTDAIRSQPTDATGRNHAGLGGPEAQLPGVKGRLGALRPDRGLRRREGESFCPWSTGHVSICILTKIKSPTSQRRKPRLREWFTHGYTASTLLPAAARLFSKPGFLKGSFSTQGHVDSLWGAYVGPSSGRDRARSYSHLAEGVLKAGHLCAQDCPTQEELSVLLFVIIRV